MKVSDFRANEYYNSLTPEQRQKAFVDMVGYLSIQEQLYYSVDRGVIYWEADGEPLGGFKSE